MAYRVGDKVKYYEKDTDYLPIHEGTVTEVIPIKSEGPASLEGDTLGYMIDERHLAKESDLRRVYTHISHSAMQLFNSNVTEFYYRYVARHRAPSIPQTLPMSVGSAFDAFVKSYLTKMLARGKPTDPKYEFKALFDAQVEPHNRDRAFIAGEHCFKCYQDSGALADLMLEICNGDKDPKFEFDVKGEVKHEGHEVWLNGKPDLDFTNKFGAKVTLDFKVNGYCSQASPKKHYVKIRDGWIATQEKYNSKSHRTQHKDAMIQNVKGIDLNIACNLESIDTEWASQLSTYAWLMGASVGSDFIAGIEQLTFLPNSDGKPFCRVSSYRNHVSKLYQQDTYRRYKQVWDALKTGHFFPELSAVDNAKKLLDLEKMAHMLAKPVDRREDWFANMNRTR